MASLSVDLDEIDAYAAIYGARNLPPPGAVYRKALPRFLELFREEGLRATFFAVGRDMRDPQRADALVAAAAAGHEIGNHTQNHPYHLTKLTLEKQRREIEDGQITLAKLLGMPPRGFRAPGYTMTDETLTLIRSLGLRYDSSVFSCPPYYAAKAGALAFLRLRGRQSASMLDHPRVLRAPAEPYKPGKRYWRPQRDADFVEIPMGVTPNYSGRLPFIGTSVMLAGPVGAKVLTKLMLKRDFVHLELHGIDLADAKEDGLKSLAALQPDMRIPLRLKLQTLRSVIRTLRGAGYRFLPLEEVASRMLANKDMRRARPKGPAATFQETQPPPA